MMMMTLIHVFIHPLNSYPIYCSIAGFHDDDGDLGDGDDGNGH